MDPIDLRKQIENALDKAAKRGDDGSWKQKMHRERSRQFIEFLAAGLKDHYKEQDTRVLWKHNKENRREFGLNELLYDILVCDTAITMEKGLRFVKKGHWAIESELARNRRHAINDFNKLVLASSDNKLFIGSQGSKKTDGQYLDALMQPARYCLGDVFIALIPHPRQWKKNPLRVDLYRLQGETWQEMD